MKNIRTVIRSLTAVALVASATSCGNVVRDGRSPSFLVIQKIGGVQGSTSSSTTGVVPLTSDVITMVTSGGTCTTASPCPTFFNDTGIATLSLAAKDVTAAAPTSNNQVTITRVHVSFTRTDGLNRE